MHAYLHIYAHTQNTHKQSLHLYYRAIYTQLNTASFTNYERCWVLRSSNCTVKAFDLSRVYLIVLRLLHFAVASPPSESRLWRSPARALEPICVKIRNEIFSIRRRYFNRAPFILGWDINYARRKSPEHKHTHTHTLIHTCVRKECTCMQFARKSWPGWHREVVH